MGIVISNLTVGQTYCLTIYTLYTLIRAIWIFNSGLREATVGRYAENIKLYHILWGIIDIPAIILGTFFPVLKLLFAVPVIPLKQKKQ